MNKIYLILIILSGMLFKGYGENRQGDFALSFPSPQGGSKIFISNLAVDFDTEEQCKYTWYVSKVLLFDLNIIKESGQSYINSYNQNTSTVIKYFSKFYYIHRYSLWLKAKSEFPILKREWEHVKKFPASIFDSTEGILPIMIIPFKLKMLNQKQVEKVFDEREYIFIVVQNMKQNDILNYAFIYDVKNKKYIDMNCRHPDPDKKILDYKKERRLIYFDDNAMIF